MESGNSSSMQSSSGGEDQEYDESSGGGKTSNNNKYLINSSRSSSIKSNISRSSSQNQIPSPHHHHEYHHPNNNSFMLSSSQLAQAEAEAPLEQPPSNYESMMLSWQNQPQYGPPATVTNQYGHPPPRGGGGNKNPRKRTRASRRAPTTVLTTDTSNFRAMVQEFTGIPSSPFSAAASPLLSRRLTDLLSSSSNPGPTFNLGSGSGQGQNSRLLAGASSSGGVDNNNNNNNNNNVSFQSLLQWTAGPSSSSIRYQPPPLLYSDLGGIIGNDQMFGFPPMRLSSDTATGWRSSAGVQVDHDGDHCAAVTITNDSGIHNHQVPATITGTGTDFQSL